MNKLVKRILALALVVCMLLGTMVIPTFATEPDAEANTVVYDFTTLTQTATAAEGAEVMWAYEGDYNIDGDGQRLYGFGGQSLNISHNKPAEDGSQTTTNTYNWINSWYNYGVRESDGVDWVKDLNWMVIGTKNTKSNCETDWDVVTIGGYKQGDETNRTSWNGLSYIHKDSEKNLCAGGWMAIKIKAPGVGAFNVDLQHTVNHYGAAVGSVYILPGVLSNEEIEAAIAAGTGKLDASVNYYMKKDAIQASEGYVTEIGSTNVSLNGQHTSLGTVTLTEVAEEYTVVFTGDAMPSGVKHCRVLPEKLTLTPVEFVEGADDRSAVLYDFDRDTNSVMKAAANTTKTMYTNGTNAAEGDGVEFGYLISNNQFFFASKTKFLNGTLIVNKALHNVLANEYANDKMNWQVLGSNVASTEYSLMGQGFQVNAFSNTDKYIAVLLRSPGEGMYTLNLNTYVNTASSGVGTSKELTSHMWMDAKLVKLEEGMSAANFADYAESAELVGSYKPDYEAHSATTYIDGVLPSYEFEAGAQYILYLSRNEAADTTADSENGKFSTNNIILNHINALPVATTVATVGDNAYTTISAAVDAVQANDTIVLQSNIATPSINIPTDVTLDLNGKKLSTNGFTTADGCKIIDSTGGNGILNILADNANFVGDNALDENILPIYDAENTGYRFYAYTYNAGPVKADPAVEGAVRFWYQIKFADDAAYDLIATGNSGVTMGVNLAYNDTVTPCVFANNAEAEISNNAAAWAAAYATFAKTANDPWLWVRVQGVDAVSNLSVAPVITAGNTDFAMDSIAYGA